MSKNIYVMGHHALSQSYCKKLTTAKIQGLLKANKIVCVENPAKFILKHFKEYDSHKQQDDLMIPDHTAKHVMLQVFMEMAKKAGRSPALQPIRSDCTTPFLHKSDNDSIWAMSFATWSCPPTCTEPAICPHLADTRTWEMGKVMEKIGGNSGYIFACHILYEEIAAIGFDKIHEELFRFQKSLEQGNSLEVFVATHSHCHGIAGKFVVE